MASDLKRKLDADWIRHRRKRSEVEILKKMNMKRFHVYLFCKQW